MTEYKKLTDEELIRRLRMGETGIMQCICLAERQTT